MWICMYCIATIWMWMLIYIVRTGCGYGLCVPAVDVDMDAMVGW